MSILINHPSENKLDLIFIDPRNVMKGNAELTVQTMDNQVIKINTLKGLILRNVLRDNNIEIYTGKNKIGDIYIYGMVEWIDSWMVEWMDG